MVFRRFLQNIILSYKSIYGWMSLRKYLSLVIIVPFFQIALFSYLNYFIKGIEGMQYAALGNALYNICVFVVFTMGSSITSERRLGTLQTIMMTPSNKIILFITKSIIHIFEGIVTCGFSLIFGRIFLKLDFSSMNWTQGIIVIFTTTLMMIGVGLFAGMIGLLFRRATPILNFINISVFLLCGVNFPIEEFPVFMQVIAHALPLTYGIKLLRLAYSGMSIYNMDFVYLIISGIIFLIVSIMIFIISERYSRQKGILDYY